MRKKSESQKRLIVSYFLWYIFYGTRMKIGIRFFRDNPCTNEFFFPKFVHTHIEEELHILQFQFLERAVAAAAAGGRDCPFKLLISQKNLRLFLKQKKRHSNFNRFTVSYIIIFLKNNK